jgi:predicted amidohydrolase
VKIAALQLDPVWEDRQANYKKVQKFARSAHEQAVDWLVLPEMFATGFSMDASVTAEAEDGPTVSFVKALVEKYHMGVVAGLVLKNRQGPARNMSLAVGKDGVEHRYTKTHLFSHLDEHLCHQAGPGPQVFPMSEFQAACFLCYDLRFPELFRLVVNDCQVMVLIASWPQSRQHHWDCLLPARSIENQCYFVGVNRIGHGGGLVYKGGSAIYGPMGEILAHAGESEGLIVAEIDARHVYDTRADFPFLKDKRFI